MKFALGMIFLSGIVLVILGINSSHRSLSGGTESLSTPAGPDEAAFRALQREYAAGRFPFLVSSMCRDFLDRHPNSPHRAEVEAMLKRSQQVIAADEAKASTDDPAGDSRR